jgi:hypothetical protein
MKKSVLTFALAGLAVVAWVGIASADGPQGPAPGVVSGGAGVSAPDGTTRYIAIPAGRDTIVEAVQTRGGRVVRWNVIPGTYGNPLVAWDGTTGGLSVDGKTLALASYSYAPPALKSRFAILATKTMGRRALVALPGIWSFDAMSPDASTLFLIQYRSNKPDSAYSVRAFDLRTRQLVPGAIVDRREDEASMRGSPVTRKTSADGRWAYTLYARQGEPPFVHALDTAKREAFCVDLPLRLTQQKQSLLRLRFAKGVLLEVLNPRGVRVAHVDLASLEARRR